MDENQIKSVHANHVYSFFFLTFSRKMQQKEVDRLRRTTHNETDSTTTTAAATAAAATVETTIKCTACIDSTDSNQ